MGNRDEKAPLTWRPFEGVVHAAFVSGAGQVGQTPGKIGDKSSERRDIDAFSGTVHSEVQKVEAAMEAKTHAAQVGKATEQHEDEAPRRTRAMEREPVSGVSERVIERLMEQMGAVLAANSQTLNTVSSMVERQGQFIQAQMTTQTAVLGEIRDSLATAGEAAEAQAEILGLVGGELRRMKKGKSKLFRNRRSMSETAISYGLKAGAIGVGGAVGWGLVRGAGAMAKMVMGNGGSM